MDEFEHDLSHGAPRKNLRAEVAEHNLGRTRNAERGTRNAEPSLMQRLALDHGLGEATVQELIADYESATGNTEQIALAAQYQAMKDWMHDALHLIRRTLQNQKTTHPDSLRTLDTACLAMGFTDVCDAKEAAELARRYAVKKETVNKPKLDFQRKVAMPPAPGQRTAAQRAHFAETRVTKIKALQGNNQALRSVPAADVERKKDSGI